VLADLWAFFEKKTSLILREVFLKKGKSTAR
jgi:hypothetical protein